LKSNIKAKKMLLKSIKQLSKRYTEQQKDVRNNREFNSLTKEVEFQELEIQLAEKQIKELKSFNGTQKSKWFLLLKKN
jgi:hypothetical protein